MTTPPPVRLRRVFVVTLLGASLALASCAGSTTSGPAVSVATAASTAVSPSAAVTTPTASAAPSASPEALAANLTTADLGSAWQRYPSSSPVYGDQNVTACPNPLDERIVKGNQAESPILQRGDRSRFAQSNARVFPDAASAKAFVVSRLTDAYAECRRAELQAGIAAAQPRQFVVVDSVVFSDGKGAYQGSITLRAEVEVSGARQVSGSYQHNYYLKGATVIDVFEQQAGLAGDPADLSDRMRDEIDAAMVLVLARVRG